MPAALVERLGARGHVAEPPAAVHVAPLRVDLVGAPQFAVPVGCAGVDEAAMELERNDALLRGHGVALNANGWSVC